MSAQPAEIYWEGLRPNVNKLFLPQAVSEQIVGIEAATNEAKMEEDKEEVVKEEPNIESVGVWVTISGEILARKLWTQ